MNQLNFHELSNEIETMLVPLNEIVLATCSGGKVTARTMCPVNDGLTIYFGTSKQSEKTEQLLENTNVALAAGSLQIQAVAEILGHPDARPDFTNAYVKKFPHLGSFYPTTPNSIVVAARPTKIAVYRYLGKPCTDVLDVQENKAYRVELTW